MRTDRPLEERFQRNVRRLLRGGRPHLLVAFSGGLDSTVLLHLLRFAWPGSGLTAAHFDHRMRDGSAEDASWAARQSASWGVDFELGVADRELRSEADARTARYAFLRALAVDRGAAIVTAHHADDQAETVLFRILRGTGIHGLSGIPARTGSGLLRPLLPFWRAELEEYAGRHELEWRTDPSNATEGPVRNRLRHRILPEIERSISPRARQNLVTLAKLARETEGVLARTVRDAVMECVRQDGSASLLSRERLAQYDPALRARVLRKVLSTHGIELTRAGTRTAIEFITGAHSGREHPLPGGGRIRIEFDHARVEGTAPERSEDEPLAVPEVAEGEVFRGGLLLGGRRYRVTVRNASGTSPENGGEAIWRERLPTPGLRYPLQLRGRRPGDLVRTPAGRKSLKKLMIERRVPLSERGSRPVLTDAEGRVLWVAGVSFGPTTNDGPALEISIHDD